MKLKAIVGLVALTLSVGAYADSNYFAPEHIQCRLTTANKLSCEGFNRQYLQENAYTGKLEQGKDKDFTFHSAAAYFTPSGDDWSIFVTYKGSDNKEVQLRTTSYSIKPDLENGEWIKMKNEFYTCDAGYRRCPMTNLPTVIR